MRGPATRAWVGLILLLAAARVAQADPPAPTLVIVDPAPGRYVSGSVTLRARVEPEDVAILRVTFAADGHPVCAREAPPWECGWDAGPDIVTHHIRALAVLRDGTRLVDTVRTEGAGFTPSVDVDVVQVAATVTDEHGRLVKGLTKEAFRVFEDGALQEVSHFIGEDAERELVVAVDMSGSMGPAMASCRAAAKRFLGSLRPMDRVTLLAFNDNVFTVARREVDPAARVRAVDRLRSWGSTVLYDATLKALDLLEHHRGRRALVLFTDGEDQISHATVEDVERRIEVSAAPVYVIAQGRGMREAHLKRVLDRMAAVSGGRSFYTDRIDQLEGVFTEIGEDLASQYLLAYSSTNAEHDGSWRTIRVDTPGKKYTVRARQGYRAVTGRR
jgi:VWFA-related protein